MTQVYMLTALTDIWTGDANGKPDRTITTGLLGSIRWWFEVLVRGLGGRACDPTKHQCEGPQHCVVCELFGCTGWARKFRFEVLDQSGQVKLTQIKKGDTFNLRFTELRPIQPVEWALLDLTLRLIAKYGAIGGKTKIQRINDGIGIRSVNGIGRVRMEAPTSDMPATWKVVSAYLQQDRWHRPNEVGFKWAAANKLKDLPGKHRSPEALLAHLQSDQREGGK